MMTDIEFLNVEIRPHRSLSDRGFIILISIVTALNCAAAAVFLAMGATLVPIFLGLDVLALVVAFIVSFASGRRIERLVVTQSRVQLIEETPRRTSLVWEGPTAFTRLTSREEDERLVDLRLTVSGREAPVGQALGPKARLELMRTLETALHEARRPRTGAW